MLRRISRITLVVTIACLAGSAQRVAAQTDALPVAEATSDVAEPAQKSATADDVPTPTENAAQQAKELAADTNEKIGEIAESLDKSQVVQDASSGVLKPIYSLAEALAFPAFYWVAFALMVAGCVSFAFQLALGKLVVLAKGSMSVREILSDSIGLVICLIGLVLTTQAATENSTFPESPSSVLSATAAGVLLGLFLYRWGQAEEIDAAKGRKIPPKSSSSKS